MLNLVDFEHQFYHPELTQPPVMWPSNLGRAFDLFCYFFSSSSRLIRGHNVQETNIKKLVAWYISVTMSVNTGFV